MLAVDPGHLQAHLVHRLDSWCCVIQQRPKLMLCLSAGFVECLIDSRENNVLCAVATVWLQGVLWRPGAARCE